MTKNNYEHYSHLYAGQSASRSYEVRNKVSILEKLPLLSNYSKKNVLEIGFGSGDLLNHLSKSNKDNVFVGLEFVSSALFYVKKNNFNLHLSKGNAKILPYHDESFDIVICSHVIEHLEDDNSIATEITRVLKQDGSAIIAVPVYGDSPLHYRQYNTETLKFLFKSHGLNNVYLKAHGSVLSKTIHKLINLFFPENFGNQSLKKENNRQLLSPLKKYYYEYFVPLWLFMDKIDDFFAYFDKSPIQIVGIFKKDELL